MPKETALYVKYVGEHMNRFVDEANVISDHRKSMDCWDCQAFLQLGIDAYKWLVMSDRAIRRAALDGKFDYDERIEKVFETLTRAWLAPCEIANKWISKVRKRGYELDNLEEFRKCEASIRSMIRFLDDDGMTGGMRALRDEAIEEHARGETAEFV